MSTKPNGFTKWVAQVEMNGEEAVIVLKHEAEQVAAENATLRAQLAEAQAQVERLRAASNELLIVVPTTNDMRCLYDAISEPMPRCYEDLSATIDALSAAAAVWRIE